MHDHLRDLESVLYNVELTLMNQASLTGLKAPSMSTKLVLFTAVTDVLCVVS